MSEKAYRKELDRLSVEWVKLQEWAAATGARICVLFEGRDGAGKDGTIKAIMQRVNSRVFRVVALPAPSEREKSQMYTVRPWKSDSMDVYFIPASSVAALTNCTPSSSGQ
nr:hypothetical protein [Paraburkholderia caffeinitolerans]